MKFPLSRLTPILLLALWLTPLVLTGCGRMTSLQDRREERDPLIMRGDARKRAGDSDGAIEQYLAALERKPSLAIAHLKLGVEYDDRQDFLRAHYHYTRYLEMRPRAEKRELIEELAFRSRNAFAATLPNPPPGAIEQIALLTRENSILRERIQDLESRVATLQEVGRRSSASTATAPASTPSGSPATATRMELPAPPPVIPESRTYRVERGDTLSSIAARMYNDPRLWTKIYDANRNILPTEQSLRPGQVLVIPR